jgi:hypothetical protein
MTAGLKLLSSRAENASYSATKEKLAAIQDALTSYLGKYGRLPCPDTKTGLATPPDGTESRNLSGVGIAATCLGAASPVYFGVVPYITLGLSRETVVDGWENYISYAVSSTWTLTFASSIPAANMAQTTSAGLSFNVGDLGQIVVDDRDSSGNPIILANATTGGFAVAVIISHGKNGMGAVTSKGSPAAAAPNPSDEHSNSIVNIVVGVPTYFKRGYTDTNILFNNAGAFDDVVLMLKPNDLIIPLTKDGTLQSATGTVASEIALIRMAAIGYTAGNCILPSLATLGLTALQTTDPWGQAIGYSIYTLYRGGQIAASHTPGNPTQWSLIIYSMGPNGVFDTGAVGNNVNCPAPAGDDIYQCFNYSYMVGATNSNCP